LIKPDSKCEWILGSAILSQVRFVGTLMNDSVMSDRPRAVISGRSLLLRLVICIVTVAGLSIGGALLMHAAIDPAADAAEGAASLAATPVESR
jgi:hypothetical protein